MSSGEEVFLDDVLVKHASVLRRDTALSIRTDLHPAYVVGDPAALNKAIAALIDNALGNAVSAIDLAVYRRDAQAVIMIGHDGPRAAASQAATSDSSVGRQNRLDLAARIVAGHGGTLTEGERVPRGDTVTVRLPSTRQR
jgi:K+-sensing histidine kinase KdpD